MATYSAEGLDAQKLSDALVKPKENLFKKAMADHESMERRIRYQRKNWYASSSNDLDDALEAKKTEVYRQSEFNYITNLVNQLQVLSTSNYGMTFAGVRYVEGPDKAKKWQEERNKMKEVLLKDENYRMYFEVNENYHKTRLVLADKTYKLNDMFIKHELSKTFETRSMLQEKVKNHKKETDDLKDRVKELEEQLNQTKARVLNLEKEKEENANRVRTENEKLKEKVKSLKRNAKNLKEILQAVKKDLETAEARADNLEESQHHRKPTALTSLTPGDSFDVAPHTEEDVNLITDETPNKKRKSS